MVERAPDAKKPKHRSPSYPAIDLETALERASQLYDYAPRHYVPVADAIRVWGYSPKSSGGLQTIGALNRFGLIDDQGKGGSRQVRVSDLARAIVTDDPASPQRLARIQEAALMPKIHLDLWNRYDGDLPPDGTLRWDLVNVYAFGEGAARELIEELRRTLEFAGLAEGSAMVSEPYRESEETQVTPAATATPRPAPPQRMATPPVLPGVQLPLGPGQWATLQGSFPVSERQWELMLSGLQAMKPGLVTDDSGLARSDDEGEAA